MRLELPPSIRDYSNSKKRSALDIPEDDSDDLHRARRAERLLAPRGSTSRPFPNLGGGRGRGGGFSRDTSAPAGLSAAPPPASQAAPPRGFLLRYTLLRTYGFTDPPPSLPVPRPGLETPIRESSWCRRVWEDRGQ